MGLCHALVKKANFHSINHGSWKFSLTLPIDVLSFLHNKCVKNNLCWMYYTHSTALRGMRWKVVTGLLLPWLVHCDIKDRQTEKKERLVGKVGSGCLGTIGNSGRRAVSSDIYMLFRCYSKHNMTVMGQVHNGRNEGALISHFSKTKPGKRRAPC